MAQTLTARKADLPRFRIPDHGLFAAGLVRDIVPDAEMPVRVS